MSQDRSWYEFRNANGATDILLYDQIGGYGISASSFVDALSAVKSKAINLYVNSPGGDVADGTAIFNALKRHAATVHATVDGMAASAASFVVQAADKISMGSGSVMMIHDAHGLAVGDAATMAEMGATLGLLSDNIAQIYADRAGGTADEWRQRMRDETWYKAADAVTAGLADELVNAPKASNLVAGRVFNLSNFRNVPEWVPVAAEIEPPKVEKRRSAPEKWPLLAHHASSGAVDCARMRFAVARAHNLNIPVTDRLAAIRHLQGHAATMRAGSKVA